MSARRRSHARRRGPVPGSVALGVLIALVGGAVAAVAWVSFGGPGATPGTAGRQTGTTGPLAARSAPTTAAPPTTTLPPTTTVDPGSLPQTEALPTTTTQGFATRVAALWSGVQSGTPPAALPAFFPGSAYVQLKDIGNPSGDFTGRLLSDYEADVAAAHQLLGFGAPTAQLVGVDVDAAYAHWIPPNVCDNRLGYFEVPNSRVVYSVGGQQRSFGIASMISWRGEWYVVHLGAILRSGNGGEVDDPEPGPGVPTYSSTC